MRTTMNLYVLGVLLGTGVWVSACSNVKEVEGPEILRQGTVEVFDIPYSGLIPYDPATDFNVYVYLPPGYDPQRQDPYPVLYLLHGFGANAASWIDVFTIDQIADYLINAGKIGEMVIVMPTGRNLLGGGWYTDGAFGPYETYISQVVVDTIKARYNVSDTNWVIAGQSMGGYGTARLFARHHDQFRGAAIMEGMLSLESVVETDLDGNGRPDILDRIFEENGGPVPVDTPLSAILGPDRVVTTFMAAMAAQWAFAGIKSPDSIDANRGEFCLQRQGAYCLVVLLPFRNDTSLYDTSQLILDSVFSQWMTQDAKTMLVDSVQAGVIQDKPLLVLAASQDDYLLQYHARKLRDALLNAGFPDSLLFFAEFSGYGVFPPNRVPPGHTQYIYMDLKQVLLFADHIFRGLPFSLDIP